jgi:hypothetical protein
MADHFATVCRIHSNLRVPQRISHKYIHILFKSLVRCYRHSGNEYNLRAKLEDLLEIEKRRSGQDLEKAELTMSFSDAARLLNSSVTVLRTLGWAWRWAQLWVAYNSSWEPLLEKGQDERNMTDEELKIVHSTRESRCEDARKCRLPAFGAALRNRCYDTVDGFDSEALERALRAVLSTKSLAGPLNACEIDFFVDWLSRAYRSKSRLLYFGEHKNDISRESTFCAFKDMSPKFELGDRPLPGAQHLPKGQVFEVNVTDSELDDLSDINAAEDEALSPRSKARKGRATETSDVTKDVHSSNTNSSNLVPSSAKTSSAPRKRKRNRSTTSSPRRRGRPSKSSKKEGYEKTNNPATPIEPNQADEDEQSLVMTTSRTGSLTSSVTDLKCEPTIAFTDHDTNMDEADESSQFADAPAGCDNPTLHVSTSAVERTIAAAKKSTLSVGHSAKGLQDSLSVPTVEESSNVLFVASIADRSAEKCTGSSESVDGNKANAMAESVAPQKEANGGVKKVKLPPTESNVSSVESNRNDDATVEALREEVLPNQLVSRESRAEGPTSSDELFASRAVRSRKPTLRYGSEEAEALIQVQLYSSTMSDTANASVAQGTGPHANTRVETERSPTRVRRRRDRRSR